MRRLPDGIKGHPNLQILLLGKNDIKRLPLALGMLNLISNFKYVFKVELYISMISLC